jgi:hypothetical protein
MLSGRVYVAGGEASNPNRTFPQVELRERIASQALISLLPEVAPERFARDVIEKTKKSLA